jgi:hypothetical protein
MVDATLQWNSILGYVVANEQPSFQSIFAGRLMGKLRSNISRDMSLEFGTTNFTERFSMAMCHPVFSSNFIINLTPGSHLGPMTNAQSLSPTST